jgi:hypothetical protein
MPDEPTKRKRLPEVGGRVLPTTIASFTGRCLAHIQFEQEKAFPSNALIELLCDAVRLAREFTDSQRVMP